MIQDFRFGIRMLLKHKGFTAVAVFTLALSIGANTTIFSVMNALLLHALPVKAPDELFLVAGVYRAGARYSFSYPLYKQLRSESRNFSDFFAAAAASKRRMNVGRAETEFIRVQEVTGNFFSVLGVPAILGRTFSTEDDQTGNPQPVAVISHNFWQRQFGGDPTVVGKTITLDDAPLTIVGVAPPGFFGFQPGEHPDLWGTLQQIRSGDRLNNQGNWDLHLMGRLPAGGNQMQAQVEFDLIFQRHLTDYIKSMASYMDESQRRDRASLKLELQAGAAGYTELRSQFRRSLLLLMTAVGLVLLVTCVNVACLLLAHAAARQREFTMRSALGAGRLRLVLQLLTESMPLAALGGLLGLFLAQAGTQALLVFMRLQIDPVSFSVAPDARVLLFTLTTSVLTGLLFGLVPALRSSRLDMASALKGASGSVAGNAAGQRLNQALVVAQVALSLALLISVGLLVRTLEKLKATDAGFDRENVVVFNLDFTQRLDAERRATLYKELLARLETLPGVRSAGMSDTFLLGSRGDQARISAEGFAANPGQDLICYIRRISQRFFETTATPLVSGRGFGPEDERPADPSNGNTPVAAVINQAMARRYFGDADPLGRRFFSVNKPEKKFEIVGVVKDVLSFSVVERTREIGVRIALGARRKDVLALVVSQGLKLALLGLALGLIAALAVTRFVGSLLYGVTATDPLTFVSVSFLLAGVALIACYLPARRATKVDPIVALRAE